MSRLHQLFKWIMSVMKNFTSSVCRLLMHNCVFFTFADCLLWGKCLRGGPTYFHNYYKELNILMWFNIVLRRQIWFISFFVLASFESKNMCRPWPYVISIFLRSVKFHWQSSCRKFHSTESEFLAIRNDIRSITRTKSGSENL